MRCIEIGPWNSVFRPWLRTLRKSARSIIVALSYTSDIPPPGCGGQLRFGVRQQGAAVFWRKPNHKTEVHIQRTGPSYGRHCVNSVDESLADRVARALRGEIEVRQPKTHFLINNPDFWDHCHRVAGNSRNSPPSHIFVDGFAGCCHWNSWKVYEDAIEAGVSLWMGYAFCGGSWTHHAWCMTGGRIIETTVPFRIYYGAQLTVEECEQYRRKYSGYSLQDFEKCDVYTMVDGLREVVPYDSNKFSQSIGRERDPNSLQVKEGLGR